MTSNGCLIVMRDSQCSKIPKNLKQLARLIVMMFYEPEDLMIIDMLVRNGSMYESKLEKILKYDKKLLVSRLDALRNDKIISFRNTEFSGPTPATERYYFINYIRLVNVVKFKLDKIRKHLEKVELDGMTRAAFFRCTEPSCLRSYGLLSARELFLATTFSCVICSSHVIEDTAGYSNDPRLKIVKFNEQFQPIYELLKQVDLHNLTLEMFEFGPPMEVKSLEVVFTKDKPMTNGGFEEDSI